MSRISLEYFAFSMLFTMLIASLLGMVWAWVWALGRMRKGLPILACDHATPFKRAPWGGLTVLSLVFLYLGVNVSVARLYAMATGRHLPRLAKAAVNHGGAGVPPRPIMQPKNNGGTPALREAVAEDRSGVAKAESPQPGPERPQDQSLAELMLQSAVSNGLLLVLVPAFVRLTSRARLNDLGLHWKEWPRQIGIGVRAAMLMTPPVCAVQFVTTRIWRSQTHPVEQMVLENFTLDVAILAVLSTMVLAPLIEELLFRGILQRWLERFVDDGSLQAKTSQDSEQFVTPKPWNESTLSDPEYEQPRSILIDAGSELLHSGNHSVEVPVSPSLQLPILFTSIVFAAMHLPQWPAPLAIFLLSMALGTVYQRTGSLLASIAMHAAFNGINTLVLLLAALGQRIQAPIEPAATAFSLLNLLADVLFIMSFT